MSACVLFSEFGRWQLRGAVDKLRRIDPQAGREFLVEIEALLRSPKRLSEREAPIAGFPEFPSREVQVRDYRVFVRRTEDAVWVIGVWPARRESAS